MTVKTVSLSKKGNKTDAISVKSPSIVDAQAGTPNVSSMSIEEIKAFLAMRKAQERKSKPQYEVLESVNVMDGEKIVLTLTLQRTIGGKYDGQKTVKMERFSGKRSYSIWLPYSTWELLKSGKIDL